ncbi:hypothetical protein [Flavobacterium sp.]|uniref:hypothetical protein n=1 Tax=Flavobacterium sp. TaxID=239 RepID=UPI00286CAE47|nr:hypothetical protein [Flavobacterium sp.]
MKKIILFVFLSFQFNISAQNMIYLSGGSKIAGKITDITSEKIAYKNLANPNSPIYEKPISNVKVAFNESGDYLVFSDNPSEGDKANFIKGTNTAHSVDVVVDREGKVSPVSITDENETDIAANENGGPVKLPKSDLAFLIRKSGSHQLFSDPEAISPLLSAEKSKVAEIRSNAKTATKKESSEKEVAPKAETPVAESTPTSDNTAKDSSVSAPTKAVSAPTKGKKAKTAVKPKASEAEAANQKDQSIATNQSEATSTNKLPHDENEVVMPDLAAFGAKALEKTQEFTRYIQTITSVNTDKEAANKSVDMACGLFLDENARVEVSNAIKGTKNKYKIRDYLNRLLIKSGQYDKVQVEYANISYASKFKKGADGNYYGSVTFVQKFQGFIDGNLVYGDQTKRSVTVILKHYEKAVEGQNVSGWDVFLDDVGVVETKKL